MSLNRRVPASARYPERSISIEYSDEEYDDIEDDAIGFNQPDRFEQSDIYDYRSEVQRHKDIKKLKEQSISRLQDKWEDILERYSRIDDEKESDEIDIITGDIITDNGHLKSLGLSSSRNSNSSLKSGHPNSSIWSANFNWENEILNSKRRESRVKKKKNELRQQLKEQDLFHVRAPRDEILFDETIPEESTRRQREEVCNDNILLLTPSPTKRAKISPSKKVTPQKSTNGSQYTPVRLFKKDLGFSSTESNPRVKSPSKIRGIHKKSSNSGNESSISETESIEDNSMPTTLHMGSPQLSPHETYSSSGSNSGSESDVAPNISRGSRNSQDDLLTSESETPSDESDFNDEYSIISSPYGIKSKSKSIYNCAFRECHYCTGNKSLYKSHLLEKHAPELYSIGYPIKPEMDNLRSKLVFPSTVKQLAEDFPLVYEVPALPLTSNGLPLVCGSTMGNGKTCKKWFLTNEEYTKHLHCSSKRQVLMCPLLGCGFMTDEGYLSWRNHFVEEKHYMDPRHKKALAEAKSIEVPSTSIRRSHEPSISKSRSASKLASHSASASPSPLASDSHRESSNSIVSKSIAKSLTSDISSTELTDRSIESIIPEIRKLVHGSSTEFPLSSDSHELGYESIDELFSDD